MEQNADNLKEVGFTNEDLVHKKFLNLRYEGTDTSIMIDHMVAGQGKTLEQCYEEAFHIAHQLEFGFNFDKRPILIDNIRVRSIGSKTTIHPV